MSSDEKQRSQEPTPDTPETIKALFKRCERKQEWLDGFNPKKLADVFRQESIFAEPLFPSAPKLDRIEALVWKGHLHEALVEILREARAASDDDKFWYVLVQWLRSEGAFENPRTSPGKKSIGG
jgi:hypothetical protein